MGYTTEFAGKFNFDKPLSAAQVAYIKAFNEIRHMRRYSEVLVKFEDPLRLAVGLPLGVQGEFFVNAEGFRGQERDASVIDYNLPPETQPGLWCQWVVNDAGTELAWDESEKFYNYIDWLAYLIDSFFKPWGIKLNGEVDWQGAEDDDAGTILVKDNDIVIRQCENPSAVAPKPIDLQGLLNSGRTLILRKGAGGYHAIAVKDATRAGIEMDRSVGFCLGYDVLEDGFSDDLEGVVSVCDSDVESLLEKIVQEVSANGTV